jgi:hypothetical protein
VAVVLLEVLLAAVLEVDMVEAVEEVVVFWGNFGRTLWGLIAGGSFLVVVVLTVGVVVVVVGVVWVGGFEVVDRTVVEVEYVVV